MTAYQAAHSGAVWLNLNPRGRLLVTGEDAARLLHAISTNDIKGLAGTDGLYAFFLNAQGRILADAYIYRRGVSFFLDTEPETAEKLREHIDKYIIADDAVVDTVEGWGELALEGPQALQHATALGLPIPSKHLSTELWSGGFTARVGVCAPDGIRVFAPASELEALREKIHLPELSSAESRLVRIENAIPRYGEEIAERYLVQETGQLQAVHFNKGCYLGQEIVERVRSRAQVHRHLRPVRIEATSAPEPGTKLRLNDADAAEIVSAAFSPRLGEVVAFAYVRTDALKDDRVLRVANSDGKATVLPLPPRP